MSSTNSRPVRTGPNRPGMAFGIFALVVAAWAAVHVVLRAPAWFEVDGATALLVLGGALLLGSLVAYLVRRRRGARA